MSSNSVVDRENGCQPRAFLTPQATWNSRRISAAMPHSEKKPRRSPQAKTELFHVIHKVPSGNSPYVRAKHVQLIDKDPGKAISLFWAAINSGDRVDSALKDMAIVMKQLDRSDEAIEAIMSFRHLCPPSSQDSLDNILVELYKQSGRIEEEIQILQLKVKQLEEGLAFGGKRIKMARSQGKKIQISVEKEYSRLLGNLAWAYMQQKDFKSAEEHYRKALSFESDKNKQCNLALCLLHMNKLTEAKFLLQAVRVSSDNGELNESYARSYERASQMLVELESRVPMPMKRIGLSNESGIARGFADGHLREMVQAGGMNTGGLQSSQPPLSANRINTGVFTELPYERKTDFDWRRNSYQLNSGRDKADYARKRAYEFSFCNEGTPKVPFTQPRRCSWSLNYGNRRNDKLSESSYGSFCRKLSFDPSADTENVSFVSSQNDNYHPRASNAEMPKVMPGSSGKDLPAASGDWTKCSLEISSCDHKKSWADVVEEDEKELESWRSDIPQNYSSNPSQDSLSSYQSSGWFSTCSMNKEQFNDENMDYNIVSETPRSMSKVENLTQKMESINLESGYFTQPEKTTLSMNQSLRRSLCFDQNQKPGTEISHCNSPLPTKALDFESQGFALSEDFGSFRSTKQRNRLQAFREITHVP